MTNAMRLTLLCHGRPAARPSAFPADEPLIATERPKITEIVARLGKIDRVLTSPAHCAWQTAELISTEFQVERLLADINLGRWTGKTAAEIEAEEPGTLTAWSTDPDTAPHGGESRADLMARTLSWLNTLGAMEGHTVAVTHPNVMRAVIVIILSAQPVAFLNIDIEHLGMADFRSNGRRWTLRSLGRL